MFPTIPTVSVYTMDPFVAIMHNSLILALLTDWSNCFTYKAKTVIQGASLSFCGITVYVLWTKVEDSIIPLQNSVDVCLIGVVNQFVVYHA